jgi:hypothetical protein
VQKEIVAEDEVDDRSWIQEKQFEGQGTHAIYAFNPLTSSPVSHAATRKTPADA